MQIDCEQSTFYFKDSMREESLMARWCDLSCTGARRSRALAAMNVLLFIFVSSRALHLKGLVMSNGRTYP